MSFQERPKVMVRVDGSLDIGLGHLTRCIALAQMIEKDFLVTFCCLEAPIDLIDEIILLGFGFHKLGVEADFISTLEPKNIVILDHYGLDVNYQKKVKEKKCILVCIDDLHLNTFYADLIINHSPSAKVSDYRAQVYTEFALGLEYALLRPAFTNVTKRHSTANKGNILICFGGSDKCNFTIQALRILLSVDLFHHIVVVTGASYENSEELNEIVRLSDNVTRFSAVRGEDMAELMSETDVAVVPASSLLFEALAVGTTPIVCYYAGNQKEFHDYVVKSYGLRSIGLLTDSIDPVRMIDAVRKSSKTNGKLIEVKKQIEGSKHGLINKFKRLCKTLN